MGHRNQGTGNYKGNRDRHEKRQSNSARRNDSGWVDQGKHTNSDRNRSRGGGGGGESIIIKGIKKVFGMA